MKTTTTSKTALEVHAAAVASAAEWAQTITDLEGQLGTAIARQPESPSELAAVADEQVKLERRLDLARAALAAKEAEVLEAGRAVVAGEADALEPEIEKTRAVAAAIDGTTAKLRKALDDHLNQTRAARQEAEQAAAALKRQQDGLRAAVAGEGLRKYFGTVDALPALLHPVTGILPQAQYQEDLDQAAEEKARQEWLDRARPTLAAIADKLKIRDGLDYAWFEYERPDPEWVRQQHISAEVFAAEFNDPGHLEMFDQAVEYADAASLAQVVKALTKIRQKVSDQEDLEAEARGE